MKLHTQFQAVPAPQPWLYRTVHNLAVDHQRRANRIVLVGNDAGRRFRPAQTTRATRNRWPDEQIARWEGIGLVAAGAGNARRAQPRIDPAAV